MGARSQAFASTGGRFSPINIQVVFGCPVASRSFTIISRYLMMRAFHVNPVGTGPINALLYPPQKWPKNRC